MARTVTDAATLLGARWTGVDPRDPATEWSRGKLSHNYVRYLKRAQGRSDWHRPRIHTGVHEETDRLFEQAVEDLRAGGAVIIDHADIPMVGRWLPARASATC